MTLYISELELQGFKSFAHKTKVSLTVELLL